MKHASVPLCLGLLLTPALAWAGGGGAGGTVIRNIAVSMVAASALGFLMKVLRQPLLLGYVLGGVLVGPLGLGMVSGREEIETLSEIGLILLLFMIGLEIDLRKMLAAGRLVIVTGVLQFPVSLGLGWLVLKGLTTLGLSFGEGAYAVLYIAVAISISSTMIVVKLLYDKRELDTLPGRLTVGILVFQDLWAIIVLAVQPNLSNPELSGLLRTFGSGAVLVGAALAASRFVLPRLFQVVAKVPELMLVLSLGWCFLVGLVAAHPAVGLSMEMGALIAGVSLATFPYNLDVIAKVLNIRDFFITLFFVSLGMQIPVPDGGVLLVAGAVALTLLLTRLAGVFGILHLLKAGRFSSILPSLNLAQMSEFSLVILAMGFAHRHIGQDTLTVGIWSFALLAVGSTYIIGASHALERLISRGLDAVGLRATREAPAAQANEADRPIVLLGFFRVASALLDEIQKRDQHLLRELKVVDFSPEARERITALGIPYVYGDVSHPDTLHHAQLDHARVLISSVPDNLLRGTSNSKLLKVLRELNPSAQIIVTAESPEQAAQLYEQGADYVLQPQAVAGVALITAVQQARQMALSSVAKPRGSEDPGPAAA